MVYDLHVLHIKRFVDDFEVTRAGVPKLLWVWTYLGISWPSRDPLNEMSRPTRDCFTKTGQNMRIYV